MKFNFVEIEKLIGRESGAIMALDKVSKSDIRHFCELIDDDDTPFNKINWEEKTTPPAMMMVWTMPPLWSPEPKEPIEPHELAFKALDKAGYDSAIGIALEQEFLQSVKVGDQLSYKVKLADISSDEVETKMGKGYKVDLIYTISNQKGEIVSTHNYTVLKFSVLNPAI
jgi:hypothetical protein